MTKLKIEIDFDNKKQAEAFTKAFDKFFNVMKFRERRYTID